MATRYTEELEQAYDAVFSIEAVALPFSLWLDHILDTLLAFHFAHPAFLILLNTPVSSGVTNLTCALPQELQSRFEKGFERRAPTLDPAQRHLSVEFFKAALLMILRTDEDQRRLIVGELKNALRRYLEPLLAE